MAIASDLNTRRSQLYAQQDTAGVVSLYTADALYVELLPVLEVFKGPDQIKGHLDELIHGAAERIVPVVRRAWRNPDGSITASGDYVVISRRGPEDAAPSETSGHFVQTLRREESGAWRIATHVFARPDPITSRERQIYD
jgi:ketosteroid isomerase-like protein